MSFGSNAPRKFTPLCNSHPPDFHLNALRLSSC